MNKLYANMKLFALKIMGLFGYKQNHPTSLEEMIIEGESECSSRSETSEPKKKRTKNPTISFKKAILGDLKNYFYYIKRMKTSDKEAYSFYSKMGASLVTDYKIDKDDIRQLPSRWKTTRPSFGCVFTSVDADKEDKEEGVSPSFMYFTKFKRSPEGVQLAPEGWDVYRATAYFHKRSTGKKSKINASLDFCVAIDPENNVKFLLCKTPETITIRSKKSDTNGQKVHSFTRCKWGIPEIYIDWAKEKGMNAEDFMVHMFKDMANFYDAASYMGMVEINVQRDNIKAKFCIQPTDAVSMFKDREKIGNSRKNIFHSVVPHTRIINGVEKKIKLHFRGQRDFVWNGYAINITVPVRESILWMPEIDVSSIDENDEDIKDGIEFGDELADYLISANQKYKTKYVS